jgi:hypothetical protein
MATERLVELLLSGQFCDVTVVCRDGRLPMSRLVLAAFSPALGGALKAQEEIELQAGGEDL